MVPGRVVSAKVGHDEDRDDRHHYGGHGGWGHHDEVSFRWEGPFKGVSRSIVTRCLRQATDMPSHSRALGGHFFFFFPFFPLAISPF
jgi:hypothetical protein